MVAAVVAGIAAVARNVAAVPLALEETASLAENCCIVGNPLALQEVD